MNILVFNCGSSSLKYKVLSLPREIELAGGEAERIGPKTSRLSRIIHRENGREQFLEAEMRNHQEAFERIYTLLQEKKNLMPDAIGHRFVHGGSIFREHILLKAENIQDLEKIRDLAKIHNPPAISLIKACMKIAPEIPEVLVFDTAYHSTIPDYARMYAIPEKERKLLGARKYGFHGTSHAYVAGEAAKMLGKTLPELNAVSCHLGSGGASLCAIKEGQSIDNTMGFSPLQGLVMSTRSGDMDPCITLQLLRENRWDADMVEKILNNQSGILGMSGFSADIRDVLTRNHFKTRGIPTPAEIYLWRIRKYLGAYLCVAGPSDAVIFTDTIGETVPEVREYVCADMEIFGIRLDHHKNKTTVSGNQDVSSAESPVRVLIISTNEELAIARTTYELAGNGKKTPWEES
ncbi:MAG: acetate/propionate family kinase [Candidatus Aureabacteria bacterium]|nr:acetate/propionate family kinase [Candidatus Auribacterota bacterium]